MSTSRIVPDPVPATVSGMARRLGLGKATVSRALSGGSEVSATTRARVLGLAGKLGYAPDPGLASLSRRRWARRTKGGACIALLHAGSTGSPGGAKLRELCRRLGYVTLSIDLAQTGASEVVENLSRRRIAGLVLCPIPDTVTLPALPEPPRCVVMGDERPDLAWDRVSHDWQAMADICLRRLRLLGYRRPGFAMLTFAGSGTRQLQGDAMRNAFARWDGPTAGTVLYGRAMGDDALVDWFHRKRPDAVIASNDKAWHILRGRGVDLPGQAGFCSLFSGTPGIASFASSLDRNILLAVELVNRRSGVPTDERIRLLAHGAWRDGASLPTRTIPNRVRGASCRAAGPALLL